MPRRSVRIPTSLLVRAKACAVACKLPCDAWIRRAFAKVERIESDGRYVVKPVSSLLATREDSQPRNFPEGTCAGRTPKQMVAAIAWAVEFCEARIPQQHLPTETRQAR